ncbi:DUF397 domain-containing protein [Streptomyces sp. NPDC088846]|uniref:DUF397 domain-containing protein n=1 Tax=Streptomyces sp. NPDC088846 TaxID=3365908 RepID=UPI0037F918A2
MSAPTWQRSSYCAQGEACAHVAATGTGAVELTESGDPTGAVLRNHARRLVGPRTRPQGQPHPGLTPPPASSDGYTSAQDVRAGAFHHSVERAANSRTPARKRDTAWANRHVRTPCRMAPGPPNAPSFPKR